MTTSTANDRAVPTWEHARLGDSVHLRTAAGTITVSMETRSRNDPRPYAYYATVFGHQLKRTFEDKDQMKAYAVQTAMSWMAKGLADLEAYSAANKAG